MAMQPVYKITLTLVVIITFYLQSLTLLVGDRLGHLPVEKPALQMTVSFWVVQPNLQ